MEIVIIVLSFAVGCLCGWTTLLWRTVKKHDRHLLQMELEFDRLKAKYYSIDTVLDSHGEDIEQVKNDLLILEDAHSKMNENIMKPVPSTPLTPITQCWFSDGSCMNPLKDCINCPRPNTGGYTTMTDNTQSVSTEGLHKKE